MKKIIALALISLLTSVAQADQIPDGCYVAFSNPGYCFISSSGLYEWTRFADDEQTKTKYGRAMGTVIIEDGISDSSLASCNADYNSLVSKFNVNVNDFNNQLKLVKKLRKACGTKCKKIK